MVTKTRHIAGARRAWTCRALVCRIELQRVERYYERKLGPGRTQNLARPKTRASWLPCPPATLHRGHSTQGWRNPVGMNAKKLASGPALYLWNRVQ